MIIELGYCLTCAVVNGATFHIIITYRNHNFNTFNLLIYNLGHITGNYGLY